MNDNDERSRPPSELRVHILGALRVSGVGSDSPRTSPSLRRLIALLAAIGPDGIDRNDLALELWGEPLPESWKSALRNRITSARRLLGAGNILSTSGRIQFAPSVRVDSWDLINHRLDDWGDPHDLAFLESEPLVDVTPSRMLQHHMNLVADARSALVQKVVSERSKPLTSRSLQTLRHYQRKHSLDATITRETIRAHVHAGATNRAATIVDEIKVQTKGSARQAHPWIDQLDDLIVTGRPRRRAEDKAPSVVEAAEALEIAARSELFSAAARDEDWSVALEIAMSGLPAAAKIDGDPDRLKLLEAIPLDKLDPARQFTLSLSMTRHLMFSGREDEAHDWSMSTRELASTPNEELLAFLTRAIIGDTPDERTPISLPAAFETGSDVSVNMQSLQVAVISHLERASFPDAARLRYRFNDLVEASADPYRRWHKLLLQTMVHFVDGEIDTARESATRVAKYAELFGIADAEIALLGQLSNAHWVHSGFDPINNAAELCPTGVTSHLGRALQAARNAKEDGSNAADVFLRSFDWRSRYLVAFPTLMVVAGHVRDRELRRQVAERLKRRTGTSAICGTGVLHLGPVDRVLAQLVEDPLDQELHAAAAVDVADRQQNRIWQVVTRLDLEAITGNGDHRRRAEQFATTDRLHELVSDYESAF